MRNGVLTKGISLFLALMLVLVICGCASSDDESGSVSGSVVSESATSSDDTFSGAASEASEPEASEPEASEPEASEPEASELEASELEASEPEVSASESSEDAGSTDTSSEAPVCEHEIVTVKAAEATCTSEGKTEEKYCAKCGEVLLRSETVPAKGHDIVNSTCTRCNKRLSDGLVYKLNDDGVSYTLSGIGTCTDTDLFIPDTYNGLPVTRIIRAAFQYNTTLTSVTIPDSVISIEFCAFNGCKSLAEINVPDSVINMGADAFFNTAYHNDKSNWEDGVLYIGNHLVKAYDTISGNYTVRPGTKSIGETAFNDCKSLESIILPDGLISIAEDAFWNCPYITSINIPDSVRYIGISAFFRCARLKSVVIPNGVTRLEGDTFSGCSGLTSLTLPKSLTYIGGLVFTDCTKLEYITYQGTIKEWKAIEKSIDWKDSGSTRYPHFTGRCTDGDLSFGLA